ncbi:hypothetical protein NC653_019055 [Populus alba x Populus x berolinensis]|uniref:Uncharacterized protein n=2 Tax=Populus alba x Populus x berolinensis TaxID=444605 RepID=A0AAD6QHU9_9ROSI|nr:hypothetical protein NC653_019055 [Populus alba x Populus x berolinensis]
MIQYGLMSKWVLVQRTQVYVFIVAKGSMVVLLLVYHLAGIKGQVEACKKVPPNVKWQMKQLIEDLTMEKEKRKRLRIDIGNSQSLSNDEVKEGDIANPTLSDISSQANKILTMQDISANKKKMTLFVPRNTPNSQPNIKSAMASKEKEHNARKEGHSKMVV